MINTTRSPTAADNGQLVFLAVFALSVAILSFCQTLVASIVDLYPIALPAQSRFIVQHAPLLYFLTPVTVFAALVVFLAPGMMIVFLLGGSERAADFILRSFLAGYLLRFGIHAVAKLSGLPVTPGVFFWLEAITFLVLISACWMRRQDGIVPWSNGLEARRLLRLALLSILFVAVLIPELAWSDFTGDAVETLFGGLSLVEHIVPRYQHEAGFYGLGIGLHAHAYLVFWFGNLFDFNELASRLPLVLYFLALCAGLVGLAEHGASRRLNWSEELAIALGVIAVLVTLGFNSSYYRYSADLGAPTAVEGLTLVLLVGILHMLWTKRAIWLIGFAVIAYFNRPSALVLLGFLAISVLLFRDQNWRRAFVALAAAAAFCLLLGKIYEWYLLANSSSGAIEGLGRQSLLARVQYLRFNDYKRFLYLILPSGLVPFLALAAVRRQDVIAKQTAFLTLLYFSFFYVLAFHSLHHFAPAMVLPLVILWRLMAQQQPSRWVSAAATAGALAAIIVAIPPNYAPARQIRDFSRQIDSVSGEGIRTYRQARGDYLAAKDAIGSLTLGPPGTGVSATRFFEPVSLFFYAWVGAERGLLPEQPNYRLQPASDPPPEGWQKLGSGPPISAYVRDVALWRQRLGEVPPEDFASPAYRIPVTSLFRSEGIPAKAYQVDLSETPFFWRFF